MSCLKTLVIPNKITNVTLILCLCLQVFNKFPVHLTHVLLICGCVVVWLNVWSSGHVVKWPCGQVVKWSSGHGVMWSSGHVVKWSCDQLKHIVIMNTIVRPI